MNVTVLIAVGKFDGLYKALMLLYRIVSPEWNALKTKQPAHCLFLQRLSAKDKAGLVAVY